MTREGACMRKAVLVVNVFREEKISVRLQYSSCSYWWESCQKKSLRMFSYTFIVIWNLCQLSQVINKDFILYIYSSNKSYNSLKKYNK